jgi:hypothetical protein
VEVKVRLDHPYNFCIINAGPRMMAGTPWEVRPVRPSLALEVRAELTALTNAARLSQLSSQLVNITWVSFAFAVLSNDTNPSNVKAS